MNANVVCKECGSIIGEMAGPKEAPALHLKPVGAESGSLGTVEPQPTTASVIEEIFRKFEKDCEERRSSRLTDEDLSWLMLRVRDIEHDSLSMIFTRIFRTLLHYRRLATDAPFYEGIAVDIQLWQEKQFGDKRSVAGAAAHLARELREIERNPNDLEEHADALFMLLQVYAVCGVPLRAVFHAAAKKLEKNRQRTWQEPDGEGVIEHDRSADA